MHNLYHYTCISLIKKKQRHDATFSSLCQQIVHISRQTKVSNHIGDAFAKIWYNIVLWS
jgi:predicted SprT family Zn-dependent metalloprotease